MCRAMCPHSSVGFLLPLLVLLRLFDLDERRLSCHCCLKDRRTRFDQWLFFLGYWSLCFRCCCCCCYYCYCCCYCYSRYPYHLLPNYPIFQVSWGEKNGKFIFISKFEYIIFSCCFFVTILLTLPVETKFKLEEKKSATNIINNKRGSNKVFWFKQYLNIYINANWT